VAEEAQRCRDRLVELEDELEKLRRHAPATRPLLMSPNQIGEGAGCDGPSGSDC
jgi:hypothetical protein